MHTLSNDFIILVINKGGESTASDIMRDGTCNYFCWHITQMLLQTSFPLHVLLQPYVIGALLFWTIGHFFICIYMTCLYSCIAIRNGCKKQFRNPVIKILFLLYSIGDIISYCGYWCINQYLFIFACLMSAPWPTGAHAGSK